MKFAIEPIWPWPLIVLACALMIAVLMVGYPRRIRHLPSFWRRLLIGLRAAVVLLITLWMLRPAVVMETNDKSQAVIYVVGDSSRSMETADAPGGVSRRESLRQLAERAKPLLEQLDDSVEIRYRDLSEDLQPVDTFSPQSDGRMTAIGAALETLADDASTENTRAVLLWSDGKQAASSRKNVDALQAARLLARQNCPIYAVPFGSAELLDTALDVSVSELDVSRDVFIRNVVPVRVRLRALGVEGRDVALRVLVEQRGNLPNGQTGEMVAVRPDQSNITLKNHHVQERNEDTTIELQFIPQEAGEIKIAVEAEPLNDELRRTNNRVETIIRVRAGGIRVAYFDRLRPEYKWLRRINVSSRVQLDHMWLRTDRFAATNEFNEDWFEAGNYDAFIIGDVPAGVFGDERLQKIYACCQEGAGFMMIGGERSFGPGGWHRTPLARLLPIVMNDDDQQYTDDIQMLPTRAALSNPILQIAPPDQNSQRWNELPPLTGASVLKIRDGAAAQILAESPQKIPLLISQTVGKGRVMAFAGDTTWQWAMRDDWAVEAHQRFWRQVIFWLTRMEIDSNSPVWVNVEPRDLSPGRPAELTFGARDAKGLPLVGVEYQVQVQRPDGEKVDVPDRAVETHAEAEFPDTMDPGDYWVTVAAPDENQSVHYASTRFLVNHYDPELDNPEADPALMRELAHVSAGDYLTPDQMIDRLQSWVDDGLPGLELKRSQRTTLWDNWISLLLFVGLLTLEWMLRKKRGLV